MDLATRAAPSSPSASGPWRPLAVLVPGAALAAGLAAGAPAATAAAIGLAGGLALAGSI